MFKVVQKLIQHKKVLKQLYKEAFILLEFRTFVIKNKSYDIHHAIHDNPAYTDLYGSEHKDF